MTNDGAHSYTYDAENRVVSVDGGAMTYAYDHVNRRVKKTISGVITHCVWEGSKLFGEYNGSTGAQLAQYWYAGSRLIAKTEGTATRYFISDRLSVRMVLDVNGNVVGRQAHLPYGEDFGESGEQQKQHFTSYERDTETGTDYAMNRAYSQNVGRFTSADSYKASGYLTNPRSWNRYSYSRNDPINRIDRLGLQDEDPPIVIHSCPAYSPSGDPSIDLGPTNTCLYLSLSGGGTAGRHPPLEDTGEGPGGGGGEQLPMLDLLAEDLARLLTGALDDLTNFLNLPISENCQKNVMDKLAAAFSNFSASAFARYLLEGGAQFFNGLTSNAPVAGTLLPTQAANAAFGQGATIAGVFSSHPGINAMTSITLPTLTIFLRPGNDANGNPVIDPSNGGHNARNQSLLFHEGLHGFLGKGDQDIQNALFGSSGGASSNITEYIRANCFN